MMNQEKFVDLKLSYITELRLSYGRFCRKRLVDICLASQIDVSNGYVILAVTGMNKWLLVYICSRSERIPCWIQSHETTAKEIK